MLAPRGGRQKCSRTSCGLHYAHQAKPQCECRSVAAHQAENAVLDAPRALPRSLTAGDLHGTPLIRRPARRSRVH
jgi:hypothetical protein